MAKNMMDKNHDENVGFGRQTWDFSWIGRDTLQESRFNKWTYRQVICRSRRESNENLAVRGAIRLALCSTPKRLESLVSTFYIFLHTSFRIFGNVFKITVFPSIDLSAQTIIQSPSLMVHACSSKYWSGTIFCPANPNHIQVFDSYP